MMFRMRIAKRLYNPENLTPDERFRLVVKATGRGDNLEETKLLNTTPMKHYEGRDWRVVSKLQACERIAVCFTVMALEHERDMMCAYLIGFREKRDMHGEALEILRQLQSLKKTLDLFCEEIDIDPLDIMAFHPCGQKEYLRVQSSPMGDDIEINEAFYEALVASF